VPTAGHPTASHHCGPECSGLEPADDALRTLLDDLTREQGIELGRAVLVDPDDAPDAPDEPTVHRGDLYALGDHRLAAIEDEKKALGSDDPRLLELSREAELISKRLVPKTVAERALVVEGQA
jgi:hypothetical protein